MKKALLSGLMLACLAPLPAWAADAAPAPAAKSPKPAKPIVVLDPGHGGAERGVKLPDGQDEAVYSLALARKVAEALKKAGLDPRLTRDSDVALSAASRTALANGLGAKALVSLHVNASFNPLARGLRVFVPAPGPVDEPSAPLWEQASRLQAEASKSLGQHIATALASAAPPSAGSGQAAKAVQSLKLALFRGLSVPAAEVELDYASNPESKDFLAAQDALAARLAVGIGAYVRRAGQGGGHAAQP